MTAVPTTPRRHPVPAGRRAAILQAALPLFVRRGVSRTQIADIRSRSGASTGSIYHHFGSKEGVAAALLTESLTDYQAAALRLLDGAQTAREGVEGLVCQHIAWVVADPDRARFLLMAREPGVELALATPLRAQNRKFFAAVESWVARHAELRAAPRDVLYAVWLGPAQELTRQWLGGRTRQDPTDFAPTLADAAWRALTHKED
jgi:AcrR family transcriptional regulator